MKVAIFGIHSQRPGQCDAGGSRLDKQDIVDTAARAGTFNTLSTALQAAGLADTLKGKGPFTVFAPTDEAFSKLPAGTVESLLRPENKDKLKAILLYHVVSGDVTAAQVVKLSSAKTANGQDVKIMVDDGTVMVNDAKVVQADVMASNGVIHVIDTVLIPNRLSNGGKNEDVGCDRSCASRSRWTEPGSGERCALRPGGRYFRYEIRRNFNSQLRSLRSRGIVGALPGSIVQGNPAPLGTASSGSSRTLVGVVFKAGENLELSRSRSQCS